MAQDARESEVVQERRLERIRKSRFSQTLAELVKVRLAKFGLGVLAIAVIAAAFSPLLATHDPVKINPRDSLQSPGSSYWLGADRLGRDQLARLILRRARFAHNRRRGRGHRGSGGHSDRHNIRLGGQVDGRGADAGDGRAGGVPEHSAGAGAGGGYGRRYAKHHPW